MPSQFVLVSTLFKTAISVYGNILKQMNSKLIMDLYRIKYQVKKAMIVGIDIINEGK